MIARVGAQMAGIGVAISGLAGAPLCAPAAMLALFAATSLDWMNPDKPFENEVAGQVAKQHGLHTISPALVVSMQASGYQVKDAIANLERPQYWSQMAYQGTHTDKQEVNFFKKIVASTFCSVNLEQMEEDGKVQIALEKIYSDYANQDYKNKQSPNYVNSQLMRDFLDEVRHHRGKDKSYRGNQRGWGVPFWRTGGNNNVMKHVIKPMLQCLSFREIVYSHLGSQQEVAEESRPLIADSPV